MKFRKLVTLLLALGSLSLARSVSAQEADLPSIPKTRIEFADGNENLNASVGLSIDDGQVQGDLAVNLENESLNHNARISLLSNKDPVWNTITAGAGYGFEWTPNSFVKQKLDTFAGYQNTTNQRVLLYSAGQFFAGGEEAITLGIGNRARFEATGKTGGYLSLVHNKLMWDNYKAGLEFATKFPDRFGGFNSHMGINYQRFNPDKYHFVDRSVEFFLGLDRRLDLEELTADFHLGNSTVFGTELWASKVSAGGNLLLNDYGLGFRTNVEFDLMNPEFWKVHIAGGKTVLRDSGYLELSVDLTNAGPSFGLGFRLSPTGDGDSVVIRENLRQYRPLIREQGYTRQGRTFEQFTEETNTPTEIGNIGLYLPYRRGASPTRTPEEVLKNGGGDCDELAMMRARLLNSLYVGYVPTGTNSGHAFSYYVGEDGRVYVTDNDHGAWFRVNVDKGASELKIAEAAIAQLHRYLALNVSELGYSYSTINREGQPLYTKTVSDFKSQDPGYAPIDTGLETHIGSEMFYRN